MKIPSELLFLSAGPAASLGVLLVYWSVDNPFPSLALTLALVALMTLPLLVLAAYVCVGAYNIKKHGRPDIV